MSSGRLAVYFAQLLLSIFLSLYSIAKMLEKESDESFSEYVNLEDCINKNWSKRNPEQYCRKIRSKVRTARWRKYG